MDTLGDFPIFQRETTSEDGKSRRWKLNRQRGHNFCRLLRKQVPCQLFPLKGLVWLGKVTGSARPNSVDLAIKLQANQPLKGFPFKLFNKCCEMQHV